jgi:nitrous oxidase accessory protein NosD
MRRSLLLAMAAAAVVLALPSSAFGQATRTWVSGVGDDANPCSRTAPCKTFAGAISKTANGGEINVIDPGGFGGVTITKSLTIRGRGNTAGALVSGTNAIVVNAAATDKVTIDGLDINGIGTGAQTSLTGIKILSAAKVNIVNNEIYRFKAGVVMAPTGNLSQSRVVLRNNHIYDNGVGVINAPGNNTITNTVATLRDNLINDNTCGVASGAFGTNASTPDANTNCGTAAAGVADKVTATRLTGNAIFDNATGIFSRGLNSTVDIADNHIVGNAQGLRRIENGVLRTTVPATNFLRNGLDDSTNATTNLG